MRAARSKQQRHTGGGDCKRLNLAWVVGNAAAADRHGRAKVAAGYDQLQSSHPYMVVNIEPVYGRPNPPPRFPLTFASRTVPNDRNATSKLLWLPRSVYLGFLLFTKKKTSRSARRLIEWLRSATACIAESGDSRRRRTPYFTSPLTAPRHRVQ